MTSATVQRAKRIAGRVLPPLVVLLVAAGTAAWLITTRPVPARAPPVAVEALVEVVTLQAEDRSVAVTGRGEVVPSVQVSVQAEVGGRVAWLNERFSEGGLVALGEPLLRLDDREYRLAVTERRADVQSASVALREEEARARVARREREILGELGRQAAERELATREPQLRAARARLEAARSALERAALNLSRTEIVAPFSGMVRSRTVDEGQTVAAQMELATIVGVDHFRVRAALPVEDAALVRPGNPATIRTTSKQNPAPEREGRVVHLLADLEPVARQARVLVEVPDPLGLELIGGTSRTPLLIGTYAEVEIEVGVLPDVFALPLAALRPSDLVFVMDDEERLRIREVEVIRREPDAVVIKEGLAEGELVVVSPLPGAVEGMALRAREQESE